MAEEAPIQMAKLLHVPVIHACHSCSYKSMSLGKNKTTCFRTIEGHTMIVNQTGEVLASDEGSHENIIMEDLEKGSYNVSLHIPKWKYWIPDMSRKLRFAFWYSTRRYHKIYEKKRKSDGRKFEDIIEFI